ncbi:MAG: hypothetical protein Q7J16_02680 [Candidatus Cloacimonadales bacterium]|nr:hypothetical protein [Candidatus Cloacimonadales bacterium]
MSFELPIIPENYDIDSVLIRLYQFQSFCNGSEIGGVGFPEWNIPGGDTVKCIMSHIDYGFELDYDDAGIATSRLINEDDQLDFVYLIYGNEFQPHYLCRFDTYISNWNLWRR